MTQLHIQTQPVDTLTSKGEEVLIPRHPEDAKLLLMVDIESLALASRPVITQIAMVGYDLENDEVLHDSYVQYLPIDPQLQIVPPRRIQGGTLSWHMKLPEEARKLFDLSTGTDFEDLVAALRGLVATFNRLTNNGEISYEISSKGSKFDMNAIESLIEEVGLEVPWSYKYVTDLRTDLRRAGINSLDVPMPKGTIPHVAYWDARWQIDQWLECQKIFKRGR